MIKDLLRGKYGYEGVICTDWRVAEKYVDHRTSNGKPYGCEQLPVEEVFYRALTLGVDQFGGVNSTVDIKKAYALGVKREGEKAIRARFEESAVRLLRNFFRVGLFENPYLEPHKSQEIVGNPEFMKAGFDVQLKSIVMLKNHNKALPLAEKTKVYIEKREFTPQSDWWTEAKKGKTKMGYGVSIEMLRKHFNIVEKPEAADCALVFIDGPTVGRGHTKADVEAGGTGYVPISLQYGDYKATHARKQSIAGGDPFENFTNRTYKNKCTTTDNKYEMEAVIRAKKAMGEKPVIVVVRVKRPLVLAEIEPYADAILLGYEVQNQAYVEIIKGRFEPSGLLPMQMPKDMRTVEEQCEDLPFDMKCYKDADGNVYDYAYGLNWSGVINDWRVEKYAPKKK
jgi:beta-glucosidase